MLIYSLLNSTSTHHSENNTVTLLVRIIISLLCRLLHFKLLFFNLFSVCQACHQALFPNNFSCHLNKLIFLNAARPCFPNSTSRYFSNSVIRPNKVISVSISISYSLLISASFAALSRYLSIFLSPSLQKVAYLVVLFLLHTLCIHHAHILFFFHPCFCPPYSSLLLM